MTPRRRRSAQAQHGPGLRYDAAVRALLLLLLLTFAPTLALAQGTVTLEELTVDGEPPPAAYRTMISTAIAPHLDEIRAAYAGRLGERPALGGDYRLRLWVSAREVIRITPESTLGDESLEEATRTAIYRFRLPPEAPGGGAWVRFVVRFVPPTTSPGGVARAPSSGPIIAAPPPVVAPPVTPPAPARVPTVRVDRISGALAESAFAGALPVPALRTCVGTASGELPMRVTVDRRGRVAARAGRGSLRDRATIRCLVGAIESLTLGPEAGPTRARITITLPP
jgi:hypothetical protein